jgi:RNase H-fold protein (predicted Holliday junction resolvase)
LHEAGRNTKQSRAVIDQVAAQLILQGWLDSQALRAGMGMMADTEDDEQRD